MKNKEGKGKKGEENILTFYYLEAINHGGRHHLNGCKRKSEKEGEGRKGEKSNFQHC